MHILSNLKILIYFLVGQNSAAILTCFIVALRAETSSLCVWISCDISALARSYLLRASACFVSILFSNLFSLDSCCKYSELVSNLLPVIGVREKVSAARFQITSKALADDRDCDVVLTIQGLLQTLESMWWVWSIGGTKTDKGKVECEALSTFIPTHISMACCLSKHDKYSWQGNT